VREALFSTLESMTESTGRRFADLYAGSGAVGLEAASRGRGGGAAGRVRRPGGPDHPANIAALDLADVSLLPSGRLGPRHAAVAAVRRVFADPPYAMPIRRSPLLADLVDRWLAAGGVVVVERSSRRRAAGREASHLSVLAATGVDALVRSPLEERRHEEACMRRASVPARSTR
jgi:16S rRNA G966 N2-methylase RsmD